MQTVDLKFVALLRVGQEEKTIKNNIVRRRRALDEACEWVRVCVGRFSMSSIDNKFNIMLPTRNILISIIVL